MMVRCVAVNAKFAVSFSSRFMRPGSLAHRECRCCWPKMSRMLEVELYRLHHEHVVLAL